MILGAVGKKLGMTQFYKEDGTVISVTAVAMGPCVIAQVKTVEKDGYEAVQLAFDPSERLNKPERGHLRGLGNFRHLREVRVKDVSQHEVGQAVGADIFSPGERISVRGQSKGKGFAGGMRRHHFKGQQKTHGQKDRWRAPGSVGSGTTPGRTLRGLRMAGHLGDDRVTQKGVEVVSVDPQRNLVFIKGAIPGATNGIVVLRKTQEGG